jgi:hypothetical protein
VHVLVSARSAGDLLYADELAALEPREGLRIAHMYTREAPLGWAGWSGRIDAAMIAAVTPAHAPRSGGRRPRSSTRTTCSSRAATTRAKSVASASARREDDDGRPAHRRQRDRGPARRDRRHGDDGRGQADVINPAAQRFMASRANAHTTDINSSHVSYISHPARSRSSSCAPREMPADHMRTIAPAPASQMTHAALRRRRDCLAR